MLKKLKPEAGEEKIQNLADQNSADKRHTPLETNLWLPTTCTGCPQGHLWLSKLDWTLPISVARRLIIHLSGFSGVCVTFIILNTAVSGNIDRRQAITRKLTCIYCQVVKSLLRQDWICLPGKDLICLQCFCSQKPFLQACYSALLLATNCHHPLQHLCGLQLAIKWLMMMSKETTLTSLTNHRNMRVFASTLCDLVSIVANYLITE